MSARVHVGRRVVFATPVFRDRAAAGDALAAFVAPRRDPSSAVFALPRGGVPVARPLADALECPLLPVLVRKLPIPENPEMGFGAVTLDGTLAINERVRRAWGVGEAETRTIAEDVRAELQRRAQAYPDGEAAGDLAGRRVYLVDDGLATGYTALAAADMLAARGPAAVVLAVPCAPTDSLRSLAGHVTEAYCVYEQTTPPFAVASFYESFPDLTDAEVRRVLELSSASSKASPS